MNLFEKIRTWTLGLITLFFIFLFTGARDAWRWVKRTYDVVRRFKPIRTAPFAIACIFLLMGALAIVWMFVPTKLEAQVYFTNSTTQNGPYQYNDKALQQQLITTVRSNQLYSGIISGFWGGAGTTNSSTNAFGHTFAQPPTVWINLTNNPAFATNGIWVTNVTTTNFDVSGVITNWGGNFVAIGAP